MADLQAKLELLFDAERATRTRHAELAATADRRALVQALAAQARIAASLEDGAEAELRLSRLAVLLGEVDNDPGSIDALLDILGSDHPEARVMAGEVLEAIAFERFKEVATGIERALERLPVGSPALSELPYLLAEVGEPGCLKLLGRFLAHADPEAVAAAIEALAELGDPAGAQLVVPLLRDKRQVEIDDGGESGLVSIGALAEEAKDLLTEVGSVRGRGAGPDRRDRQGR